MLDRLTSEYMALYEGLGSVWPHLALRYRVGYVAMVVLVHLVFFLALMMVGYLVVNLWLAVLVLTFSVASIFLCAPVLSKAASKVYRSRHQYEVDRIRRKREGL